MAPLEITLKTEAETQNFAHRLSQFVAAGRSILLRGDIGSGKTFFARSLIQKILGPNEDVPSPTFTLVQIYETPDLDIWHCDLYRLTSPAQTDELGLAEAFETAFCLIEWPDRLGDFAPQDALTLDIRVNQADESRSVSISGSQQKWGKLMDYFDDA